MQRIKTNYRCMPQAILKFRHSIAPGTLSAIIYMYRIKSRVERKK